MPIRKLTDAVSSKHPRYYKALKSGVSFALVGFLSTLVLLIFWQHYPVRYVAMFMVAFSFIVAIASFIFMTVVLVIDLVSPSRKEP